MNFDKAKLTPCPILNPTMEEFGNPMDFFNRPDVAQLGFEYGILKIQPPDGWRPPFSISENFKFHTRLQKLSDLGLITRSREFFKKSINRFLTMRNKRPLRLYFRAGKRNPSDKTPQSKVYYYDLYQAVEKMGGSEKMKEEDWIALNKQFSVTPVTCPHLEEVYNSNIKAYALFLASNGDFQEVPQETLPESDDCALCASNENPSETLLCDNCNRAFHMRCLEPPLKEVPPNSWYCDKCLVGSGAYGFEEQVDLKYTIPEFIEHCKEFEKEFIEEYNNGEPITIDQIESKFWEFVEIQKSNIQVRYGADIHNMKPGEISGFPMDITSDVANNFYVDHPLNLTKLPFAQGSLMKFIDSSISGMTIPWIYVGSLLSTFCWHVEDHYTLSINYCHLGATKKWYGIPSSQADKFETLMKESAPDLFKRQPDLLHQLVTLISPMKLLEHDIKCVFADQNPNEFIVTYPRVYHSGFNSGFNFNEAVNFIIDPWLEFGERAVSDYRMIKKENVFNHYQLEENILRSYISGGKFQKPFIKKVVESLENYYANQLKIIKEYSGIVEQGYSTLTNDIVKKDDDEELLCDECKTHIGYHHFFVPNQNHQFSRKKYMAKEFSSKQSKSSIIDPNPTRSKSTSTMDNESCLDKEINRNNHTINIGLPSPKENVDEVKVKKEARIETITNSEIGRSMSDIISEPLKSKEEEFEEVIESAQRASEEPPSKRRRSTRIHKQELCSVAKIGRSKKFVPPANEKQQLKLCAECVSIYKGDFPLGTKLIYDKNPQDVLSLIRTIKAIV